MLEDGSLTEAVAQKESVQEVVAMKHTSLEQYLQEIDGQKDAESKLHKALAGMEQALSAEKTPDFKAFWEIRKKCLELFKGQINPVLRSQFWNQYSELSKQARRLKELSDEQSDFAKEQIEIAIQAIENDLTEIDARLSNIENIQFPKEAHCLSKNLALYTNLQKELNLLNAFASRITSLRKELIKTSMRIRPKNQLFERLSKAGDVVFPKRKELMGQISHLFENDVESFIHTHFSAKGTHIPYYVLREEIKALQGVAKILTLNTQTFSQTRFKLSACWDQIKELDKERKAELDKKKEIFKQNADALINAITQAETQFEQNELNLDAAFAKCDELQRECRNKELGREEVAEVRGKLDGFRAKLNLKDQEKEQERVKQEEIRHKQRQEKKNALESKAQALIAEANDLSIDELNVKKDAILQEMKGTQLNKFEKSEVEKLIKQMNDLIRTKKEQALRKLPADAQQALEQLQELLTQKQEERQEIKAQLENYRKLVGSSGLDFQKAMEYNARLAEEKENLAKVQEEIAELERSIEQRENG